MIIVGYYGIGKSSLAGKENCIDLDIRPFLDSGDSMWYKTYLSVVESLSVQGFVVLLPPNPIVRKHLRSLKESIFYVYPSLELKDYWERKMRKDWTIEELNGTLREGQKEYEYKLVVKNFEADINEMKSDIFMRWEIMTRNYKLIDIIREIKANSTRGYCHFINTQTHIPDFSINDSECKDAIITG